MYSVNPYIERNFIATGITVWLPQCANKVTLKNMGKIDWYQTTKEQIKSRFMGYFFMYVHCFQHFDCSFYFLTKTTPYDLDTHATTLLYTIFLILSEMQYLLTNMV